MDKAFAEDLMCKLDDLNKALSEVARKIEQLDDNVTERLALREGVADLAIDIYSNLMRPIIKLHPSLDRGINGF